MHPTNLELPHFNDTSLSLLLHTGRVCGKLVSVSVVGIFSYDGADVSFLVFVVDLNHNIDYAEYWSDIINKFLLQLLLMLSFKLN